MGSENPDTEPEEVRLEPKRARKSAPLGERAALPDASTIRSVGLEMSQHSAGTVPWKCLSTPVRQCKSRLGRWMVMEIVLLEQTLPLKQVDSTFHDLHQELQRGSALPRSEQMFWAWILFFLVFGTAGILYQGEPVAFLPHPLSTLPPPLAPLEETNTFSTPSWTPSPTGTPKNQRLDAVSWKMLEVRLRRSDGISSESCRNLGLKGLDCLPFTSWTRTVFPSSLRTKTPQNPVAASNRSPAATWKSTTVASIPGDRVRVPGAAAGGDLLTSKALLTSPGTGLTLSPRTLRERLHLLLFAAWNAWTRRGHVGAATPPCSEAATQTGGPLREGSGRRNAPRTDPKGFAFWSTVLFLGGGTYQPLYHYNPNLHIILDEEFQGITRIGICMLDDMSPNCHPSEHPGCPWTVATSRQLKGDESKGIGVQPFSDTSQPRASSYHYSWVAERNPGSIVVTGIYWEQEAPLVVSVIWQMVVITFSGSSPLDHRQTGSTWLGYGTQLWVELAT